MANSTDINLQNSSDQSNISQNSAIPSFQVHLQKDEKDIDLVNIIDTPDWKTILIDLVRKEKMDPWNINIALLADKFIEKINMLTTTDLRFPANAILASAILLKAKARVLKFRGMKEADWADEQIVVDDMIDVVSADRQNGARSSLGLDDSLPSLSPQRLVPGRVSLDSLVNAIESILEKTNVRGQRRLDRQDIDISIDVHEYDIEAKVDSLYQRIVNMSQKHDIILFSDLIENDSAASIIAVLIPLLFMMNKELINLWQEDFFGEIMITLN